MSDVISRAAVMAGALTFAIAADAAAQHEQHAAGAAVPPAHAMWHVPLPGGWQLMTMGQAFPIVSFGAPFDDGPLDRTAAYLTQPAFMANVESPGSRLVLRTTINLEGMTQRDGELTYGAWGEGFIDRRHPHTLVHELMLSLNVWDVLGGSASLSVGKGFGPYGTDDPMSRPPVKYPTNHHLSQILERWTVNGVFLRAGWSIEAGVFGGTEPEGPYDFSNIGSFGNSFAARLARRWDGAGPFAAWEAALSFGSVAEEHDGDTERTALWNVAVRRAVPAFEALIEASLSDPAEGPRLYSVLGEAQVVRGGHRPYARLEVAERPEYPRLEPLGQDGFHRYLHDADPIGATRWLIATAGYGFEATGYPASVRPFVEAQYHRIAGTRAIDVNALFGTNSIWSFSLGARLFFGGDPMRMGAYGVLDAMTVAGRGGPMMSDAHTGRNGAR